MGIRVISIKEAYFLCGDFLTRQKNYQKSQKDCKSGNNHR
jgi:hypothetical protein